jgi:hypothetical protein
MSEEEMTTEEWIQQFGSGTLRRAVEENMCWRELYLHERSAFEFGYGFEPISGSRITFGKALASADDPATTETCWWARVLRWRAIRDNRPAKVDVMYITISEEVTRESIGIVYYPETRPSWLPNDRVLVALTWDGKQTVNPC